MNDLDRLYRLLPALYHDRDAEHDYPLRDLLRVIAEQVVAVEADIDQLYADRFIETCAEWAVPYLGELIGFRPSEQLGENGGESARALARALDPRREVANTIRYRRRKGTLAVLEELARDVARWPARAVEGGAGRRFVDVRATDVNDLLGGPFDLQSRTIEARRPGSALSQGRYHFLDVLLFVWRLQVFRVTRTRAHLGDVGRYRFSILGNDTLLFSKAKAEISPDHIAEEHNLPAPIRRRALRDPESLARLYGLEKSFVIYAENWPEHGAIQPIPAERIIVTDLAGWPEPPPGKVFVDPIRGRIRFECQDAPRGPVRVSYHYGFSAAIGGGEYRRALREPAGAVFYRVTKGTTLAAALEAWRAEKPCDAVIEIADSGLFSLGLNDDLGEARSLQIRAASGKRPVLELEKVQRDDYEDPDTQETDRRETDKRTPPASDALVISGGKGSRFTLDGVLVLGCAVRVRGPKAAEAAPAAPVSAGPECEPSRCPFELLIRHCTLVPGLSFDRKTTEDEHCEDSMEQCEKPSLELLQLNGRVRIEHSILGTIRVEQDAVATEPLPIEIYDSIIDSADPPNAGLPLPGHGEPPGPESHYAIFENAGCPAHAELRLARCTVFGWIHTHAIAQADNCIFADHIRVARRQKGCIRFCYVPPDSRTPRRYQCQPDLAGRDRMAAHGAPSEAADEERARRSVEPHFVTRRYGRRDYARLAQSCPEAIERGAEDGSEMGVFHDLYEPQRAANLRARLAEFTPAGTEPGIVFVT